MGQQNKSTPKNTTRQPPRATPVPPSTPPGVDPRAAKNAISNLQQLGDNPQAIAALREVFGGGRPAPTSALAAPAPARDGTETLFAPIANCVNAIIKSADRTTADLIEERNKTAALEARLEVFKKREENEKVAKLADDRAKQQFSSVIAEALQIATQQGGSQQLVDVMVCLAQVAGIELRPDHIDTLTEATPLTSKSAEPK